MPEQNWITDIFPGAITTDATSGHLDATMITRIAEVFNIEPLDVMINFRGALRTYGYDVPPFQIRTNTWRIDLPTTVVRSVLGGLAAATIIEATGAPSLPTALLSLVAPFLLAIRRVEVKAEDITVHANLAATVRDEPRHVEALYQELPARSRAEMSLAEFAEVVNRLLDARLASVGPDGIRLRASDNHCGFRLVLTAPSLLPSLLKVNVLPDRPVASTPAATGTHNMLTGTGFGLRLADGRPRIFISYAQESNQHKCDVLTFAECLHSSGVGVVLDQDAPAHREDWQVWATKHIIECDYVLVIASPMCRQVGDGTIAPDQHKGLQAEMRTLRDLYNDDNPTWLRRILPVILPKQTIAGIPLFLQPRNADHYQVVSLDKTGIEDVLRTLTAPLDMA